MKKIFLAMAAMTAILASCSKNTETGIELPNDGNGPQVRITLASQQLGSRAFFDNTATAETWESALYSMSIYVYDQNGKYVMRKALTPAEISAKGTSFPIPNYLSSTTCSFYVVANEDHRIANNKSDLLTLTVKGSILDYNGDFTTVSKGSARSGGFVMTGYTNVAIGAAGQTTHVPVTLTRVVAKVAVRTGLDPEFTVNYGGGTVVIDKVTLSKASEHSYYYYQDGIYGNRNFLTNLLQVPENNGGDWDNLFYIYENSQLMTGSRPVLTISGFFDADSDMSTTDDRQAVEYKVELDGSGNGEIKRNAYYRAEVIVKGLTGEGVALNLSVADWEGPITQTSRSENNLT